MMGGGRGGALFSLTHFPPQTKILILSSFLHIEKYISWKNNIFETALVPPPTPTPKKVKIKECPIK